MDQKTRNEFEQLCALAEIEQDPEKFVEISRQIICILSEKQLSLSRQRPASSIRYPKTPSQRGVSPALRESISQKRIPPNKNSRPESPVQGC